MKFKLISVISPELSKSLSEWGDQWTSMLAACIENMKEAVGSALVVSSTSETLHLLNLSETIGTLVNATTDVRDLLSAIVMQTPDREEVWIVWDLKYPNISVSTFEQMYRKVCEWNSTVVSLRKTNSISHPATPAGLMGLFNRVASWFLSFRDKWSVRAKYEHWNEEDLSTTKQLVQPSVRMDVNSREITFDVKLERIIPKAGNYALIVRAWSPKQHVLMDSCLYWWKHRDGLEKRRDIMLEPLTGLGMKESLGNLHTFVEIYDGYLRARWHSIDGVSKYEIVLLDLLSDVEPYWCYPLVPDVVCWFDPSKGKLIRRDTMRPVSRRQDIPALFESMGYMCAGKPLDLVKLWDRGEGNPVGHYVVPAHEAFQVNTPLAFAEYMACFKKNNVHH